jgi:heat shock protein HslJ
MTTANAPLEGRWTLKSGVGAQLLPDTNITAEFNNGTLSGSGGVNQYSARYTTEPSDQASGKIQILEITFTTVGGTQEMLAQESEYFQALARISEYSIEDGSLILAYTSLRRYLGFIRIE